MRRSERTIAAGFANSHRRETVGTIEQGQTSRSPCPGGSRSHRAPRFDKNVRARVRTLQRSQLRRRHDAPGGLPPVRRVDAYLLATL